MLAKQASGRERAGVAQRFIITVTGAMLLLAATSAQAAFIHSASSEPDLGLAIASNSYQGGTEGAIVHTLDLAAPGDEFILDDIGAVKVTLWIDHSRAGDLTVKLVSPAGTEIFLMNRPGAAGVWGDGTPHGSARGSTGRLSAAFPVTFHDNAELSSHEMGNGPSYPIIGNAGPSQFRPSANGYSQGNALLGLLAGEQAAGQWTLIVGDAAPDNAGVLEQWSIEVTTIPEPAAATLLAAGLVLLASRRRRGL